jgi:hypothetical protein
MSFTRNFWPRETHRVVRLLITAIARIIQASGERQLSGQLNYG